MERETLLKEIEIVLQSSEPIPMEQVLRWIGSEDLEVWEYVSDLLSSERYHRVQPSLSMDTICRFMQRYFRRAIEESEDRYVHAYELNNYFKSLWDDQNVPRTFIEQLKEMLAESYKSGSEVLRDCVIKGALEHLFTNADIAKYFEDWRNDSVLQYPYDEAIKWAKRDRFSSS